MSGSARLGEIITTSTVAFTAETAALHALPALGSLVKVAMAEGEAVDIYAVVAYGETAGIDAGRRAVRRGSDDVYDDHIYREHPELAHILRTIFRARIVGYAEAGLPRHYLPPTPPPLHFSVRPCAPAEVAAFTDDLIYLRLLLAADGEVGPEHLLAAHLRAVAGVRADADDWLLAAGRAVARLFKDDYDRLLTVLQAIDPGHKTSGQWSVVSGQ